MNFLRTPTRKRRTFGGIALAFGLLFLASAGAAHANAALQATPTPQPVSGATDPDANCLMCHSDPDFKGSFADGEMVTLFVPSGEYEHSVHGGEAGLECVACHTAISRYPHHDKEQVDCLTCHDQEGGSSESFATLRVILPYANRREMSLAINESCRSCHEEEFEVAGDSAHMRVLNSGNDEAPVCVDCHGSHDITRPGEPRAKISQTCAKCHQSVYSSYRASVHGEALEVESNPDVPTCIDCHGVHSVRGPRDPSFRNDSITICGDCHGNGELMARYGISTEVFSTYLGDFHGRTVDLFRRQEGGIGSNKAVCFDCHGVHNIRRPEDPLSSVYPDNLQHTCQQCHKDASIRFPSAWLSHYIPTWEKTPVLYAANLAYNLLIPLTVSGFLAYIGLDAYRRSSQKRKVVREALAEENFDDYDFTQNG